MTELIWLPASELPRKLDIYGKPINSYKLSAGMRVRLVCGEEYLVGDVSELGGGCDCCPSLSTDVEVRPSHSSGSIIKEWCWQVLP